MDLLAKMATYVRVLEAGSLSTAAKQLRISSAAVSRQISTLEGEVGTELLARTTRKMSVTTAGQRYYERCLRILREVDEAQAIARGSGLEGSLKISAPVTYGLERVASRLRELVHAHPALQLDLRLEDRVIDLVLEGVDVAIRAGSMPPVTTEIIAHRLSSFHRVLVAAPSYLKKRGEPKTPEALAKHEALSFAVDASLAHWSLTDGERSARIAVAVRTASNAAHMLRELAREGAGIALLPKWFVDADVRAKKLRRILPTWTSPLVEVHALYRTQHRNEQRVRLLIEHLRGSYARTPD